MGGNSNHHHEAVQRPLFPQNRIPFQKFLSRMDNQNELGNELFTHGCYLPSRQIARQSKYVKIHISHSRMTLR